MIYGDGIILQFLKELNILENLNAEIEKRIESYWDTRSGEFSKVRRKELLSENMPLWKNLILEHLPKEKPLKILDVGTGAGFFAIILASVGHNVVGIDLSEKMIEAAKINADNFKAEDVTFIKMAADRLKFADETFDAVISRNLTWILPDAMEAYKEWWRVLKFGGALLNFDSDVGKVSFKKKEDPSDVHANISQELVDECNNIKNALRISGHTRPAWDIELLKSIGFDVTFEANISPKMRIDKNLRYDDLPMFAIYAKKSPLI